MQKIGIILLALTFCSCATARKPVVPQRYVPYPPSHKCLRWRRLVRATGRGGCSNVSDSGMVSRASRDGVATCVKDFGMVELWDDRSVQVERNVGVPIDPERQAAKEQP